VTGAPGGPASSGTSLAPPNGGAGGPGGYSGGSGTNVLVSQIGGAGLGPGGGSGATGGPGGGADSVLLAATVLAALRGDLRTVLRPCFR